LNPAATPLILEVENVTLTFGGVKAVSSGGITDGIQGLHVAVAFEVQATPFKPCRGFLLLLPVT
jgi:hypothetical protein